MPEKETITFIIISRLSCVDYWFPTKGFNPRGCNLPQVVAQLIEHYILKPSISVPYTD